MEIKFNTDINSMARVAGSGPKSRLESAPDEDMVFMNFEALNRSLEKRPAVRAEAVARGQALVGMVEYPPVETMQKIAHLLALNWDDVSDFS